MAYNMNQPITLHPGDDYKTANNRSLQFIASEGDDTWPTISTATITLVVEQRDGTDVFTATGTGYDSTPAEVLVELTAANTTLLSSASEYTYRLIATLSGGNVMTLANGRISTP